MCPFRAEGSRVGVIVGSIILVLPFAYLAWIAVHVWMHVVNVRQILLCFQSVDNLWET
jgi:ABC-type transport system involved in cytochrome c biogenesis permease subunit